MVASGRGPALTNWIKQLCSFQGGATQSLGITETNHISMSMSSLIYIHEAYFLIS